MLRRERRTFDGELQGAALRTPLVRPVLPLLLALLTLTALSTLTAPQLRAEEAAAEAPSEVTGGAPNEAESEAASEATPRSGIGPVRRTVDSSAELVKDIVVDGVGIVLSPFKWRTKEWLTFGAVGGATALFVLFADEPIRDAAQESEGFKDFGDKIRPLGTGVGMAALTGGMFLTGVLFDREKERETARLLIESAAISYVIESSLKHAIGRSRPTDDQGSRDFAFFGGNKSMPSGEVTLAFSMAGIVTSQYPQWWVQLLSYSLAAAVGAGRIAKDSHWASDVLLSAALGTAIAKSVAWRHRKRKEAKGRPPRWSFGLMPNGVRYTYIW